MQHPVALLREVAISFNLTVNNKSSHACRRFRSFFAWHPPLQSKKYASNSVRITSRSISNRMC